MFEATTLGDFATSFASIAFLPVRSNQLDTADQRDAAGEPIDLFGLSDEQADRYIAWCGQQPALQLNIRDAIALADRSFVADMEAREQRWLDAAELAAAIDRETAELDVIIADASPFLVSTLSDLPAASIPLCQ